MKATMVSAEEVVTVALFLVLVKFLFSLCRFFYTSVIGAVLGHNIDLSQHGPWAVVTGATDGIGKVYARKLAEAGLNIVLISRTQQKLKDVAEEISKECNKPIEIKTIAIDFTHGNSIYSQLRSQLADLDIGILINNVGMPVGPMNTFAEIVDEQNICNIINCNIMSMARMTHIILPTMIKRRKGIIINIGSLSSTFASPYLCIYGGTKGFVDKFSRDLAVEVKPHGIIVQTVHPGFIVSKLSKLSRTTLLTPNPEDYVSGHLRTLGLESRTAGYWAHKILMYWAELLRFLLPGAADWLGVLILKSVSDQIKRNKKQKGK